MRICTEIATGKIIEMQSDATPGTLTANAVAAGYLAQNVQEQDIAPEAYKTLFASQNVFQSRILFRNFILRWTLAEYRLLMQGRASAISSGGATGMTLVRNWDATASLGVVDLNTQGAQDFKAAIVTAGILTQQRADVVFNGG